MHADLAGGDVERFVAEPVAGEDVDGAENAGENSGSNDDAPEGRTERFL